MPYPTHASITVINGVPHQDDHLATAAGQAMLAAQHVSQARPRCMCTREGVELQVVRRGNRYFLARMPGTGLLHAAGCAHAESLNLYSGSDCYAPAALRLNDLGGWLLQYDAHVTPGRQVPAVGIGGLLDLLIDESGLNALAHPVGKGRQSWAMAQEMIYGASHNISFGTESTLNGLLLVPETFDKEDRSARVQRQDAFLRTTGNPHFVCAPIRELNPTPFGNLLLFKHLPEFRFWIPAQISVVTSVMDAIRAGDRYLCLAQVRQSRGPNAGEFSYQVQALALRRVHATFMPSANQNEDEVIDRLIQHRLSVFKPLRYDADPAGALSDLALIQNEAYRPVFLFADTSDPPNHHANRLTVNALLESGQLISVYKPGGWINPPFPENANAT